MRKNRWILLLLSLGLAGAAVYNIAFFRTRFQRNSLASTTTALNIPAPDVEQVQGINTISGTVKPQANIPSEPTTRPPLSIEEIEQKATDPVDLSAKRIFLEGRTWPKRDPFQTPQQQAPVPTRDIESAELPAKPSMEAESKPLEPVFKVSAILIEENRRFALVNGYPKRIGALVGSSRIVAIEPDYVIVQTPEGERKVDILKQPEDEKQIPNK
jgi:hypothetical protein